MATKLPVVKVILGAVLVPWHYREKFVDALTIPLFAMVAYSVAWNYGEEYVPEWSSWPLFFINCVLFVSFAVTCHRLVLLSGKTKAQNLRPRWSRRETIFLFWTIALGTIVSFTQAVIGALLLNLPLLWHKDLSGSPPQWAMLSARIPALYVFSRLCLVLPTTAIDRSSNLSKAWNQTKGNGLRLFAIVAVAPYALSYIISLLYRETPTIFEVVTLTILAGLVMVFEIAAISLSYRELVAESSYTEE